MNTKHQDPVASAHQAHSNQTNDIKTLQLEPNIKALLRQEMQAIKGGMMSLVPAISSGNWEKVAEIAKQMESSYLLKQKLSVAERHALHKSLPTAFIKRDKAFHKDAGMLAHAAEMGHPDIVNFYFYKLSTACVECHTEFATERFPNLAVKQSEGHHH
ncbi:MAG: hypothetical protein GQ582_09225 [Methyloprofundus sp.]|nr:hypothetical protein [Methyloprofundus sp.]